MGIPFYRLTKNGGFREKYTITNYSITLCFDNLNKSLLNNNTKLSMYWASELISSGYVAKLWEFIFEFYAKYIHIHYPNMIRDIYEKYKDYIVIKRTTRPIEVRNNIKLRDYMYRIIYIYSTLNKRFIVDMFGHPELFKRFRAEYAQHKHLDPTKEERIEPSVRDTTDIISMINEQTKLQIDNAITRVWVLCGHFLKSEGKQNDRSRYHIYNWLSFLLDKGCERFDLYKTEEYIHLKHCRTENKYSYFIWNIWNILLEHSFKTDIHREVTILYRIYEGSVDNQSTHAYYFIIAGFLLLLERIPRKNIFIDGPKYNKYKRYFYKCFGYIEEGLINREERRDKYS